LSQLIYSIAWRLGKAELPPENSLPRVTYSKRYIGEGDSENSKTAVHRRVQRVDGKSSERVHGARYETRVEAMADLFDYIEPFYSRIRRHSTLGYKAPAQFLGDWILGKHEGKLVA